MRGVCKSRPRNTPHASQRLPLRRLVISAHRIILAMCRWLKVVGLVAVALLIVASFGGETMAAPAKASQLYDRALVRQHSALILYDV